VPTSGKKRSFANVAFCRAVLEALDYGNFNYLDSSELRADKMDRNSAAKAANTGRLDSWKEIAAYLKRNVRTVQRWEEMQGLPVHRHSDRKTGSVHAFEKEIDLWLKKDQAPATLRDSTSTHRGGYVVLQRGIRALAVLPLENLSGDSEQEYFADGMTEAIITDLAKISPLRVISRTSIMGYKGTRKTAAEIAEELNVDGVVEGTVLRIGERVRITAQLIHAPSDSHIWAERYEQEYRDVLGLQREVAQAIAAEICGKVAPRERHHLNRQPTIAPEVHEAYLKGRYLWNKRTPEALYKALDYFQQAVKIDPGYALAHAGIADVYLVLGGVILGVIPPRDGMPKARDAAKKALEIDESLGEAYAALAFVSWMYDYDWEAAEKGFRTAIALNPGYATAHQWYAVCLAHLGRTDEAQAEIERARQLDPLSLQINAAVVQVFYFGRAYDRAIEHARRALDLDSTFSTTHLMLALAYKQKRMFAEAFAEGEKALTSSGRSAPCLACIGGCYADSGRKQEAERIIEDLYKLSEQKYVDPYVLSWVHANLHDAERALTHLEHAHAKQSSYLAAIKVDPVFDFLRSDHRFQSLQRRVGLPL